MIILLLQQHSDCCNANIRFDWFREKLQLFWQDHIKIEYFNIALQLWLSSCWHAISDQMTRAALIQPLIAELWLVRSWSRDTILDSDWLISALIACKHWLSLLFSLFASWTQLNILSTSAFLFQSSEHATQPFICVDDNQIVSGDAGEDDSKYTWSCHLESVLLLECNQYHRWLHLSHHIPVGLEMLVVESCLYYFSKNNMDFLEE